MGYIQQAFKGWYLVNSDRDWELSIYAKLNACHPNTMHIMYTIMLPDALIYSIANTDRQ